MYTDLRREREISLVQNEAGQSRLEQAATPDNNTETFNKTSDKCQNYGGARH